jgi:lipopolysaccharide transport system permease protein
MSNPNLDVVTVIKPNSSLWPFTPKEFWRWRGAFYRLLLKDFQVRFRDTYLGYVWVILQPLITLAILSVLVHSRNFSPPGISSSLYVLSGLIFWFFIVNGFNHGCLSLINNAPLITQTNVKRVLFPLSAVTSKLFDLLIGIILLAFWILIDSRSAIHITSVFLVVDILGIFLTLMGLTMFFSAMSVQFKDLRHVIPFLSQMLFFVTPIFYLPPEGLMKWMVVCNPFTAFIMGIRDHIFGTSFISTTEYLSGFTASLIIFMVGGFVFKKCERNFADII